MILRARVVRDAKKLLFLSQGILFDKVYAAWFDNYNLGEGKVRILRQGKIVQEGKIDFVGTHVEIPQFYVPAKICVNGAIAAKKLKEGDTLEVDFPNCPEKEEFWCSVENKLRQSRERSQRKS